MDTLKKWLLEQMKAKKDVKDDEFWRLKDWLTRVSMAEFKSTELYFDEIEPDGERRLMIYSDLVAPIKEEIKFWNEKNK